MVNWLDPPARIDEVFLITFIREKAPQEETAMMIRNMKAKNALIMIGAAGFFDVFFHRLRENNTVLIKNTNMMRKGLYLLKYRRW